MILFFLAISNISDDQRCHTFTVSQCYPWLSYEVLQATQWVIQADLTKDFRKLTLLNRFVIPFWNDIYLNLETVTNR
ncbi:CFC_HP_G0070320.mRNA.1.CDS.1 [Saccharomyces cerevisiae]|nr:CFC_HP_G0070320.mRNA.1.CDS.1 [Saccharomyces cerevisiae]CAI6667251.1 CFC_HP_G0070320.mRNA.1.CDS.1 [Saccharomyces cerevisiae]